MSAAATSERQVADILAQYEASDTAHKLYRSMMESVSTTRKPTAPIGPAAFAALLAEQGDPADAVEFLARWLSPRQRIWWGCMALWHVYRPNPPAAIDATLAALVRWVEDPSDENRRAARAAGEVLGPRHPVGALALAAYWSEGSMSLPDLPEVLPPADLSSQVLASTLSMAVNSQPFEQSRNLFQHFVKLGLEVAAEANHWEVATAEQG